MIDDPKAEIAEALAGPPPVEDDDPPDGFAVPDPMGGDDEPGDPELDRQLAFHPLTDLGNAERFVARCGDRFLFNDALGWFGWDGRRWKRDPGGGVVANAVYRTIRAIQAEAKAIRETNLDIVVREKPRLLYSDRIAAWGRASEMAPRLNAVARLAGPKLEIDAGELDRDPFLINVANGTLHVGPAAADGSDCIGFRPHDPADRITKIAPVVYDPAAACPAFDGFLAYVQPSPANRRFLFQWFGLSLTGDVSEQKLCFFWGSGRNGKSTLVDIVSLIAGDYGESIPIETFLSEGRGRNAGQATPDLAILPGIRYLKTSEPEKGARLAEALIKLVTGGEAIQARHLNRDYFRFRPQFKLTISGNHRPEVSGADEGIWRRVMLMPWTVMVPVEAVDTDLPNKLAAETSGILNRLLDGLRDWREKGLVKPAEVIEATQDYREESDPLGRFLAACTAPDAGGRVQSTDLHRLFIAWAKATGAREWSATGFGRAMRERGYRSIQSNYVYWLDLKLTRIVTDFAIGPAEPGATAPPPAAEDDYGS